MNSEAAASAATQPEPTVRVAVYMTLPASAITEGWQDNLAEFELSVAATLHEVVGDDGYPYQPHVLGVEVETDEDAEEEGDDLPGPAGPPPVARSADSEQR